MKKQLRTVCSLVLSLAILLSCFGLAASGAGTLRTAAAEHNYYVQNGGTGDGKTKETPAATVAAAIHTVNEDGLGAGDVANIYIMQRPDRFTYNNNLTYADKPEHGLAAWTAENAVPETYTARLVVQPHPDNTGRTYLVTGNRAVSGHEMVVTGPTHFRDLYIISGWNQKAIRLNGNNVTFSHTDKTSPHFGYINNWPMTGDSTIMLKQSMEIYCGTMNGVLREQPVDIQFNFLLGTHSITGGSPLSPILLGGNKAAESYAEDVTLTFDIVSGSSGGAPLVYFGNGYFPITYRKNLNLNVKSARELVLAERPGAVTINGAYQVIKDSKTLYTDWDARKDGSYTSAPTTTNVEEFKNVTVKGGSYILTNYSSNSELLTFTETAGTYTVHSTAGYAYAYDAAQHPDTLYYGSETLTVGGAGEYNVYETADLSTVSVKPSNSRFIGWQDNGDGTMTAQYEGGNAERLTEYEDYIRYRSSLENTYTKLQNGEAVNVVYFGGSVTQGAGLASADQDTLSWRAQVGSWLAENFPTASITQINRATGESGTLLGSYRVERDVIAAKPDLLFLEYAVNDYYNSSSYDDTARQYETIVRNVRAALPECDIVTVLTTERTMAENARKGTLYAQAQAHEDMAAVYNIPTVDVGSALANRVADADWSSYMSDTVHPNEAGYALYFDVIKEYLHNSLVVPLFAEPAVTEHPLPPLQSKTLLDGNVTAIQPTAALMQRSQELGGSEFRFNSGSVTMGTYTGDFRLDKKDSYTTDPLLAVEFTGTELALFAANAAAGNQVQVKIDNGDYQTVELDPLNPTVLATGLRSGAHTAYIKPDMSTFSMRVAIPVLYARDAAYQTAQVVRYGDANMDGTLDIRDLVSIADKMSGVYCAAADANADGTVDEADAALLRRCLLGLASIEWEDPEAVSRNYYVQAGGTGDGHTATVPAASVVDALNTINADGLTAGDTAHLYILKGAERATKGENEIVGNYKVDGVTNKVMPQHGFTSWVNLTNAEATSNRYTATPTYEATVVVQGLYNTAEDPTYLPFSNTLGGNAPLTIGGPTVFKDLTLVGTRRVNQYIYHNGYSVTYDDSVLYGMFDNDYTDGYGADYETNASATQPTRWNGQVKARGALGTNLGYLKGGNTAAADTTVVFRNAYKANGKNQTIYLEAYSNNSNRFAGNVQLVFDNAAAAPEVYIGNNGSGTTTIDGNLSLEVKDASAFTLVDGRGPLAVGGAIQVLVNGATCVGDVTKFSGVTAQDGIYMVQVTTKMPGALTLTDKVGVYTVAEGYTAIATDANGNEAVSVGGVLTLPAAGSYTVQVVEYYANDGKTITVYDNVTVDLTKETAAYVAGQVFLGWKNAAGQYVQAVDTYQHGDVLTAQYVTLTADDFGIADVAVDTLSGTALSVAFKQSKAFLAALPTVVESGAITLPSDTAGGREICLNTPVVLEWEPTVEDVNVFTPKTVGATPITLAPTGLLESDTERSYRCVITGITADSYDEFHQVRGYIRYRDGNGIERVLYTEDDTTSAYKVAAEAIAGGETNADYEAIVRYVEDTVFPNYRNSLYAGATTLYEDPTDPNHKILQLSNGLYERSVTVNSGFNITKSELCFYTDPHMAYINSRDIESKNINALSSYRGRTWLRAGDAIRKQAAVAKYAATFQKTVMGGDAVDYLTYGALDVTKNLITRRSVNGSLLMAVGNHEVKELSQPDNKALTDITPAEGFARILDGWSNDVYYHSETVNDADGKPAYMLVVLDNSQGKYWASQIAPLTADIQTAREKQIPILVFQHIPIAPDETTVYDMSGYGRGGQFGTPENNNGVYDTTTSRDFVGNSVSDATTNQVCDLIRNNADVVKAVFNGHWHANFYTHISGTDPTTGETVIIPQHTMYGSHYGGVMKITVE